MFTHISSRLSFIENSSILDNFFSDTTKKYAKIAGVALAIFTSIATLYTIYRCFKAREIEQEESKIPPHIVPTKPRTPTKKAQSEEKKPYYTKKPDTKPHDSPIKNKHPLKQDSSLDDEEYARKLQEQLLQEEDDDESLAKMWQRRYDEDFEKERKKQEQLLQPFKPPVKPTFIPPVIPLVSPLVKDPADLSALVTSSPIQTPEQLQKIDEVDTQNDQSKPVPTNPFVMIDNICGEISERTFNDNSFSAVKAIAKIDPLMHQEILEFLNSIVGEFEKRFHVSQKIAYGQKVPAYFANVVEQSAHDRKYLSLVGIRNLLLCGPGILDDFSKQKYLGGEHNYTHMKGLSAFKHFTGNLVDLDTEIDAKSDHEAVQIAEEMIINFGKICGITKKHGELTAEDVAKALPNRKLELPKSHQSVYSSVGNTDRSYYGVWKRPSVTGHGPTHYYVNVPNCDIVVLATLRLPYMMAELAYLTREYKQGKLMNEFYETLFNKGISDRCFNDKARVFIDFYNEWKSKLEEVPTPEEEAVQKLKKGVFGELSQMDPDYLVKEAKTRIQLIGILENSDFGLKEGFEKNDRSFEQWKKDIENEALNVFMELNLWKNSLYHAEAGKDYFLLDEATLNEVLKNFYAYLY